MNIYLLALKKMILDMIAVSTIIGVCCGFVGGMIFLFSGRHPWIILTILCLVGWYLINLASVWYEKNEKN